LTNLVIKVRKRGEDCRVPGSAPARARLRGHGFSRPTGVAVAEARERGWRSGRGMLLELATQVGELVDQTAESDRKVRLALERNRVLGKGLKTGKSFRVEGSDGTAWYEVVRVGPASVEVEWRDYGRDRCMDEMLAGGGAFPRPLIGQLVRHHDVLQELSEALA
jgi:hypothetical protein